MINNPVQDAKTFEDKVTTLIDYLVKGLMFEQAPGNDKYITEVVNSSVQTDINMLLMKYNMIPLDLSILKRFWVEVKYDKTENKFVRHYSLDLERLLKNLSNSHSAEYQYLQLGDRIINEGVMIENKRTGVGCLTVINADFVYD